MVVFHVKYRDRCNLLPVDTSITLAWNRFMIGLEDKAKWVHEIDSELSFSLSDQLMQPVRRCGRNKRQDSLLPGAQPSAT